MNTCPFRQNRSSQCWEELRGYWPTCHTLSTLVSSCCLINKRVCFLKRASILVCQVIWNDDDNDDCSSWHVKGWCIVQDPHLNAATAALLRTPWPAASVCLQQHGFYGPRTPAGSDEDCWEDHQDSTAFSVEHPQNPQENCRHSQGTPPPGGTVLFPPDFFPAASGS